MFILQSAIQFDSWCMNITIKSLQFLFSFPCTSDAGGCYIWPVLVVLPVPPANRNTEWLHDIISSAVCSTCIYGKGKGKVIPLQAWSGPEGSRKLRFPDFMTTAQGGARKVVSLTHRPPLPPGNAPGTHFCYWLRAGWFGIESRRGQDFPPVQTGPGAHPASCKMGTGSFPGVKCGGGVLLTTHPILVPRSWKIRAIPLPTLWAKLGLYRDHFIFTFYKYLISFSRRIFFFLNCTTFCNSNSWDCFAKCASVS